jgi:hypothetical protein
MKALFAEHYWPSSAEKARLWREGQFVFDANVLLRGYLLAEAGQRSLLEALRWLRSKDRLWLPHQFALEYHRGREGKIFEAIRAIDLAAKEIAGTEEQIKRSVAQFVRAGIGPEFGQLQKRLTEARDRLRAQVDDDDYGENICALFDGRVGPAPVESELAAWREEADVRYGSHRPPGFKDAGKPGDRRYGDYFGWKQLVRQATEMQWDVVFVTHDLKDDWWDRRHGETLGPRKELLAEFAGATRHAFWMYPLSQFLRHAGTTFEVGVADELVAQLEESEVVIEKSQGDEPGRAELLRPERPPLGAREAGNAGKSDASKAAPAERRG